MAKRRVKDQKRSRLNMDLNEFSQAQHTSYYRVMRLIFDENWPKSISISAEFFLVQNSWKIGILLGGYLL